MNGVPVLTLPIDLERVHMPTSKEDFTFGSAYQGRVTVYVVREGLDGGELVAAFVVEEAGTLTIEVDPQG